MIDWLIDWSIAWLLDWSIDCLIDWLIAWFIHRLIDWLIDWLIAWFIHRLIDWLIDWSIAWLLDWSIDCLIDWLIAWFIHRLIDWLIDWLIAWFIHRLIDWLIDWLIDYLLCTVGIPHWIWLDQGRQTPGTGLWDGQAELPESRSRGKVHHLDSRAMRSFAEGLSVQSAVDGAGTFHVTVMTNGESNDEFNHEKKIICDKIDQIDNSIWNEKHTQL